MNNYSNGRRSQKVGCSSRLIQIIIGSVIASLILDCFLFVSAIKPVRNLQVTYRGQTYTIHEGVTTVEELTQRFALLHNDQKKKNGTNNKKRKQKAENNNKNNKEMIVWKGHILKSDDNLHKAGVKNGDRVMILNKEGETKATDILAVYLFLLSSNERAILEAITKMKNEQPEAYEMVQGMFSSFGDMARTLNKNDVSDAVRTSFDVSYHKLRSLWENPSLRQSLHDPDQIEKYRQVVSQNLKSSKLLLNKAVVPDKIRQAVHSPQLWNKEFSKFIGHAIRFGDTILEGILDLLLDVLKGKGTNHHHHRTNNSHSQQWASSTAANTPTTIADAYYTNEMEDPSLANNLLFELSESEEDDYDDDI